MVYLPQLAVAGLHGTCPAFRRHLAHVRATLPHLAQAAADPAGGGASDRGRDRQRRIRGLARNPSIRDRRRQTAGAGGRALAASRVSLSLPVLDALHRLTGSHFLVWNGTAGGRGPSTLDASALDAAGDAAIAAGIAAGGLDIAGQRYRIGTTRSQGVRPETVLVLTPQRGLIASTLEAVWPVLAVAAATLAALLPLGLRTTAALAGRIAAVERHVGRIAAGDFGPQLTLDDSGDEVGRLVAGVNRMSAAARRTANDARSR